MECALYSSILGLPIAMVILCMTAVPIFHRARVYTAYEYLEQRFDTKTRVVVSLIFLTQRGLAAGLSLYAPAVVMSVILGWPDYVTTIMMGSLIVLYTTTGGIKAVAWADVLQMTMIFAALILSLVIAFHLMPRGIGVIDASIWPVSRDGSMQSISDGIWTTAITCGAG